MCAHGQVTKKTGANNNTIKNMDKQVLINSLALCESNLDFVGRYITESPLIDLIMSTKEMLDLIISVMDNIEIDN